MYHITHLPDSGTACDEGAHFLDNIGGMRSEKVAAQNLLLPIVRHDDFAEAFRLPHSDRLAVSPEKRLQASESNSFSIFSIFAVHQPSCLHRQPQER